jgi:cytochrome P450 family 110
MASPPPGPRSPSFVQTARFLTRPLEFFQEQVDTYGPTFTIHLAGLPTLVMLTTPADLKALFTAPADVMHAGAANALAFGAVAGTRTHFVLDRESHLERRRLMLPPFHGDRMHEYGEAMADVTARAVAAWPRGTTFAAHPQLQRITLQVILRTIFGLDERAARDEQVILQLVRLANEALASPLLMARPLQWDLGPWSPWGRVLRVVRESDRLLLAEIQKRRSAGDAAERKDILSMLLLARNEQGEGLTDAEVRDELTTLVLAGLRRPARRSPGLSSACCSGPKWCAASATRWRRWPVPARCRADARRSLFIAPGRGLRVRMKARAAAIAAA